MDQATPREIRAQAQSMTVFFTQGLGLFVGAIVANELAARAFGDVASNTPASLELWPQVWWPLCAMAVILAVLFVFAFRPEGKDT